MRNIRLSFGAVLLALALWVALSVLRPAPARGEVTLHSLFTDNMVLQRGVALPVWGTATPGATVRVLAGKRSARAVADKNGNWEAKLPALAPGAPFDLVVESSNRIVRRNVVVGDVWLCAGQSNMEWLLAAAQNGPADVAAADYPNLRFFTTPRVTADKPQRDVKGVWKICTPQTAGGFSAVGYFFGRELQRTLKVPIGLINSSWGGTDAEAWISRSALAAQPQLRYALARFVPAGDEAAYRKAQKIYQEKMAAWRNAYRLPYRAPAAETQAWSRPDFDDAQWPQMTLPAPWEAPPHWLTIDGAAWFRRTVEVPAAWAGKDLTLRLGRINDFDITFFNGTRVGQSDPASGAAAQQPREYSVPGNLVKAGSNVIAVRVFNARGTGGFAGSAAQMSLSPREGSGSPLSLAGRWRFFVESQRQETAVPEPPVAPLAPDSLDRPSVLFNAKIAPLVKFPIRGVVWYQGENNVERAHLYRVLLPALIADWRAQWHQPLPFGIVQLANYTARQKQPGDSDWAELREAQLLTSGSDPNSGLAVTIDVGDADSIHPKDKQDVGHRLALWARAAVYGEKDLEYSGPILREAKTEGDQMRLSFYFTSGLKLVDAAHGGASAPLAELDENANAFAIAGEDRRFVWARARVETDDKGNQSLVVWSPQVKKPVAVRYGWQRNPPAALFNGGALPASPFRTDDWPGITFYNR